MKQLEDMTITVHCSKAKRFPSMGEKKWHVLKCPFRECTFFYRKCYRISENLSKIPQKFFETKTNVLQVLKLSAAHMGLTDEKTGFKIF
jgi:hypothetical protein